MGCILAGLALRAWSAMPIHEPLFQTESAHFRYLYPRSLAPRLPELIVACEDAHTALTPLFNWSPRDKTWVLYDDAADEHNGAATVYPRPSMHIHAADASPGSAIYAPGAPLRSTVLHEYTHILALDAQYGADAALSRWFGRVQPLGDPLSEILALCAAPPGALAPAWYLEGLAIWSETAFTEGGRGRNSLADMILRLAVAEERLLPPRRWDLALPEWPYGQAAYLYGMRAIQAANALATNAPGRLSDTVAHAFLYDFDRHATPVVGHTFARLADAAVARERARQAERIATLQTVPFTPLRRLTPPTLQAASPRFGPDGRTIYFSGHDEAGRDTLYACDPDSATLTPLNAARTTHGLTRLIAAPRRDRLYYTRPEIRGRDRLWNAVYGYDPTTRRRERLSAVGRYRHPTLAPDGRTLAAIRNEAGTHVLIEAPLDALDRRERETPRAVAPPLHALVDPVYTPDGARLIYILAAPRRSQLRALERVSGREVTLLDWPCRIVAPAVTPDGRALIFSADRNGVYNLYRLPLAEGAEPDPLTHVLGGVFNPDVSPDGRRLAAVGYDAHGAFLCQLDLAPASPWRQPLPVLAPDWPDASNATRAAASPAPPHSTPHPPDTPYRSLTSTRLDFWSPWLTASGDGAAGGVAAAFSDPAAYQALSLLGGMESVWETPLGALIYRYAGLYPIGTLFGAYGPERYDQLVRDRDGRYYDYDETVGIGGGAVTLPWQRVDYQAAVTFGCQYARHNTIAASAEAYANAPLDTAALFEGVESAGFAQLEFFNATAYGRSHSYEDGRSVSVTAERTDDAWGGDLNRTRALGQWIEYLPLPWGANQVLRLEGLYGAGWGDVTAQGFFGLGGFGVIQSAFIPGLHRTVALRGYPENAQTGSRLVKAGAAYRAPLIRLYRGESATLPLYYHQVFGELYYEGGQAAGDAAAGAPETAWLHAAGAELSLATTVLRFADVAPGLGVVYAFDRERTLKNEAAEDTPLLQTYFSLKAVVNF